MKRGQDGGNGNLLLPWMVQSPTATAVSKALHYYGIVLGALRRAFIWWWVLPLDNMYDVIVAGVGIDWKYILPLSTYLLWSVVDQEYL